MKGLPARVVLLLGALAGAGCGSPPAGSIIFGTVLQGYGLRRERSAFGPTDTMAWVARFAAQADPGNVTATVTQRDAACPTGRPLTSIRLPLRDPTGKRQAYQVPVMNFPPAGVPIPGTYTLRYSQGTRVLAEGRFTLEGPPVGRIDFGRDYRRLATGGFMVQAPTSRFRARERMAWVAHFAQPAGARTISIAFDRVRGCRATRVLRDDRVRLSTPRATSFAARIAVDDLRTLGLRIPGTYIVSYQRGGRFLARGQVTLER